MNLKLFLFLHFLILFSFSVKSQSLYEKLDSLEKYSIKNLPNEHSNKFDTIIQYHKNWILHDSLIKSSYANFIVIEETYIYSNSQYSYDQYLFSPNFKTEEYFYIKNLVRQIEKSKPVQELIYEKKEESQHTKYCLKRENYVENTKKEIESTYQILTLINLITGEVKMSFQYPPKKAKFRTKYVGGGKC
jgi:hypothetical protein